MKAHVSSWFTCPWEVKLNLFFFLCQLTHLHDGHMSSQIWRLKVQCELIWKISFWSCSSWLTLLQFIPIVSRVTQQCSKPTPGLALKDFSDCVPETIYGLRYQTRIIQVQERPYALYYLSESIAPFYFYYTILMTQRWKTSSKAMLREMGTSTGNIQLAG